MGSDRDQTGVRLGSDQGQAPGRDLPSVYYWLLLHRPPTGPELQDALQVLAEYGRDALLTRVTTSPEFQQQYRQR
jgi:hypothetical protein